MPNTAAKLRNKMHSSGRLFLLTKTVSRGAVLDRAVISRKTSTNAATAQVTENQKPWTEIPGPSSLPILGQIHHFVFNADLANPTVFQRRIFELYGPIVRLDALLGREPHIFLYDADDIAQVLRGENTLPIRPGFESLTRYRNERNKAQGQSHISTGLITDHGETWKHLRSTVNPVLMPPKVAKSYTPVIEEVADDMIKRMKTTRDENNKLKGRFDIEMNLWSLESIGVVALGGRLNCLTKELEENSPERKLIQCVHDLFHVTNELDFKPSLWRYYPTRKYRRAMKLYDEQETLARYFINKSLKNDLGKSKHDDEKSILQKLYEIDEDLAVTMAVDMLFAGVDTVATQLTAIFYLLAKNPDKQQKLREELKKDTKYLRACIKEGMRMLPVTSGNIRKLTKDFNIAGYRLPKGLNVVFNHQMLQVMESEFPRPKEFIPERWLEKDSPLSYTNANPFSYLAFGYGVRMCIGRRIAELEMEVLLSRVVNNFHIDWFTRPIPDLIIEPTGLNYIKGPFDFVFKDL